MVFKVEQEWAWVFYLELAIILISYTYAVLCKNKNNKSVISIKRNMVKRTVVILRYLGEI